MRIVYFILLFFSTGYLFAQEYSWSNILRGSYLPAQGVIIDRNNNLYVLGQGTEVGSSSGVYQFSDTEEFIAKYKPDGTLEWTTPIGGSISYYSAAIKLDNTGNIVLAGTTGQHLVVKKLDENGSTIWERQFTIPQALTLGVAGIAIDNNDNIIATGHFSSTTCERCGPPTDFYLFKINSAGNIEWIRSDVYNNGYNGGRGITADDNGDIIVYGAGNSLRFKGSQNDFVIAPGNFLVKYTSEGEPVWAQSIEANLDEQKLTSIGTDIYVAGTFRGTITMNNQSFTSASLGSACLFKVNASGNICWTRTLGNVYAGFTAVQRSSQGNGLWISGIYNQQLDISIGQSSYSFSSPDFYGYNTDFYVLRADTSGNWKKIYMVETIEGQMWGNISNVNNDQFAVAGNFWGRAVFTGANGHDTLTGPAGNVHYDGIISYFGNTGTGQPSAIRQFELNSGIIYPNPSTGIFSISPGFNESFDLAVYNSLGQKVHEAKQVNGAHTVQLSERLNRGNYVVEIKARGISKRTKMILH